MEEEGANLERKPKNVWTVLLNGLVNSFSSINNYINLYIPSQGKVKIGWNHNLPL